MIDPPFGKPTGKIFDNLPSQAKVALFGSIENVSSGRIKVTPTSIATNDTTPVVRVRPLKHFKP